MALVVPNVGEEEFLKRILNITSDTQVFVKLFINDYVPIETSVAADFTESVDASYVTYIPFEIAGNSWTITQGDPTEAVFNGTGGDIDFPFASTETVYGYFLTNNTGNLLWAERFTDGPYNILVDGGVVHVIPKMSLE